jgi:hypothetical protein
VHLPPTTLAKEEEAWRWIHSCICLMSWSSKSSWGYRWNLVCFKRICKSWLSLVYDPHFVICLLKMLTALIVCVIHCYLCMCNWIELYGKLSGEFMHVDQHHNYTYLTRSNSLRRNDYKSNDFTLCFLVYNPLFFCYFHQ